MIKEWFGNRRARWGGLAVSAALVALVGYHVVFGEHGYLNYRREHDQYLQLKRQTDALTQENARLAAHISALKTDPHALEQVAREQLHMARKSETVIVVSEATPAAAKPGDANSPDAKPAEPGSAPAAP